MSRKIRKLSYFEDYGKSDADLKDYSARTAEDIRRLNMPRWALRDLFDDILLESENAAIRNSKNQVPEQRNDIEARTKIKVVEKRMRRGRFDGVDVNGRYLKTPNPRAIDWLSLRVSGPTDELFSDRSTKVYDVTQIFGFRSVHAEKELRALLPCFPARHKIRSGHTKEHLLPEQRHKFKALDNKYVQGRLDLLCLFRIDLDQVFPCEADFRKQLLAALGNNPDLLPFVATGAIEKDGRFVRPHLWFKLKVPVSLREGHKKGPRHLLNDVMRRFVDALIPVGADPGGLSNPFHGKNPFCEYWDNVFFCNEIMDLSEARQALGERSGLDRESLFRKASENAAARLDVGTKESNSAFTAAKDWVRANIRWVQAAESAETLTESIYEHLLSVIDQGTMRSTERFHAAMRRTAEHVAKYSFDHRQNLPTKARGALRAELSRDDELKDRQAKGGQYAAKKKHERILTEIQEGIRELMSENEAPTKANLVKLLAGKVGRSTVYEYFDEAYSSLNKMSGTVLAKKVAPTNGSDNINAKEGCSDSGTEGNKDLNLCTEGEVGPPVSENQSAPVQLPLKRLNGRFDIFAVLRKSGLLTDKPTKTSTDPDPPVNIEWVGYGDIDYMAEAMGPPVIELGRYRTG